MNWIGGKLQTANHKQRAPTSVFARQKEHFANARSHAPKEKQDFASFTPSYLTADPPIRRYGHGRTEGMSARLQRQTTLDDYSETSAIASRLSSMRARPSPTSKIMRQKSIKALLHQTKSRPLGMIESMHDRGVHLQLTIWTMISQERPECFAGMA